MKQFSVSEETLQKTFNYLASRPFGEVANLIKFIEQDAKLLSESPEEVGPSEATEPPTAE